MMMAATGGEMDELSMTVSDLSVQGRRVSDRSVVGDDSICPGNDIDSKLGPILRRMSLLEEQFAGTYRDDSEAEARRANQTTQLEKLWKELQEERRQRLTQEAARQESTQADRPGSFNAATAVLEATAEAQEAQSQLVWVTAEARNVERDFDHIISEARALLDKELKQRLESEASGSNTADHPSASSCTTECLGLRLEALEVHVNARLESLEESVCNCCDALRNEIQKNATHRVEERLNVQTMINKSLEVERAARCRLIDEERRRHEERQTALARALGEELEASIVAQAVAEVRKAACTAAREEARAEAQRVAQPKVQGHSQADSCQHLAELRQKVSNLEDRWRDAVFPTLSLSVEMDSRTEFEGTEVATPKQGLIGSCADKGVVALEQFGVSVVQLESNINSLLKSSLEARAEQNQQHTNLRQEMKKLRSEMDNIVNQVGNCGRAESVCKENVSLPRACSHSPTPPLGIPPWRLAMVPSPARSPHNGKSQASIAFPSSVAVRVASPPRQADPTPSHSRSNSAHGGRLATANISVEVEAGARGRAVSPGRPSARGGKLVAPIPGPPRRPVGT